MLPLLIYSTLVHSIVHRVSVCVLPTLRRRRLKIEIERERRTQTTALAYLLIRPAKTREWFGFSREWLLLLISLQADSTLNCCCCSSLNFTPHCLANGRTSRHCCRCRTTSIIALDNNHWLFLSLSLSLYLAHSRDRLQIAWPGLAWLSFSPANKYMLRQKCALLCLAFSAQVLHLLCYHHQNGRLTMGSHWMAGASLCSRARVISLPISASITCLLNE